MNSPYIHERRRIMDTAKKVKFCQLIRDSHSLEEAAEWVDVSIRTVQRERKRDEDFDHEIRLAQQATPDPLRLMQNAARAHWRAAAWLLERTRPEQFARQPANTARDYQVEAALGMLLEAALAATAPAERAKLYEHVQPTCAKALEFCFPQLGPSGNLKKSKLPATPLADEESRAALRAVLAASKAQAQAAMEQGERPVEWVTAPALFRELPATLPMTSRHSSATQLSPKTDEATAGDTTTAAATEPEAPHSRSPIPDPQSPASQLSPKTHEATPSDATPGDTTPIEATSEPTANDKLAATPSGALSADVPNDATAIDEPPVAIDYNLPIDFNLSYDDFAAAIAGLDQNEQTLLWDQRLRHRAAMKRRRSEREAAKREKAARKRAAASRRRNAA